MTALLEIQDLHVHFATHNSIVEAVKGISLSIPAGQTIGLVGESGSGKSVSALCILQLLTHAGIHTKGKILFKNEDLLQASQQRLQKIRGNDIAMIFQEPMTSLNPLHSIKKQIAESLHIHQYLNPEETHKRVVELLTQVGIPEAEKRLNALPHELSGGQRQRVMIAIALTNNPQLLIADEPTTALDVTIQKQVLELLRELQTQTGMSILLITHDLNIVKHMTDYIYVMKKGMIIEHAPSATLFKTPKHPYTYELMNATKHQIRAPLSTKEKPLLHVKNLCVTFSLKNHMWKKEKIRAVNNISFTIYPQETLGIVGESGCGKTSLGRALLKIQRSEGTIIFDAQRIDKMKESQFRPIRKNIQMVFQDPFGSLSPRMSIQQIIGEGLTIHEPHITSEQHHQRITQVLHDVGLETNIIHRYPHEFSGGQRQRIAIARALILNPRLIIFDEPTSALDNSIQMQIIKLLHKLQQQHQLSYLFISHDLQVIRAMTHRVLVMKEGHMIELADTHSLFTYPQHSYTDALIQASKLEFFAP